MKSVNIWYKNWDHHRKDGTKAALKEWEFRERVKHSKLGHVSKDEKLGIRNHLSENNPVYEKIFIEPVAKRSDNLENTTRLLIPGQKLFTLSSSDGKCEER